MKCQLFSRYLLEKRKMCKLSKIPFPWRVYTLFFCNPFKKLVNCFWNCYHQIKPILTFPLWNKIKWIAVKRFTNRNLQKKNWIIARVLKLDMNISSILKNTYLPCVLQKLIYYVNLLFWFCQILESTNLMVAAHMTHN